ncbi:MAG: hypothetical protein E5Y87_04000 [Mesorhizobium sp.]|nr:MAG: hypothetical protein E5Y87_04000 [Mesorhizobium sp.]
MVWLAAMERLPVIVCETCSSTSRGLRRRLAGDRYHPEEHYMRGPGPKTRAKFADRKSAES